MTWSGSRGTKCPKCGGGVCSEREEERCCETCGARWQVAIVRPAGWVIFPRTPQFKHRAPVSQSALVPLASLVPLGNACYPGLGEVIPTPYGWVWVNDSGSWLECTDGRYIIGGGAAPPVVRAPTPSPGTPVAIGHRPGGITMTPVVRVVTKGTLSTDASGTLIVSGFMFDVPGAQNTHDATSRVLDFWGWSGPAVFDRNTFNLRPDP